MPWIRLRALAMLLLLPAGSPAEAPPSNTEEDGRTLIVLAAPSANDRYYRTSNAIAVTRYGGDFYDAILKSLREAFPDVRLIGLAAAFDDDAFDPAYGSARGIHVNATVTDRFIYLPVFGGESDAAALEAIRAATDREVIPIDASAVAHLGGSVRCLGAQMKGENARRLIRAAQGLSRP